MDVRVVAAESRELREKAFELRRQVFVEEQQVPEQLERDEHDGQAFHAVALLGDRVVGTGRLVRQAGRVGRVGRMAVHAAFRRRGVGDLLLEELEARAKADGLLEVELHAQCYVEEFYRKHGYTRAGEVFLEAGIEHVVMTKRLS